jgi:protein required for attachment to host cells
MSHWIVVADASGARIFSATGRSGPLELVKEFSNPTGRARTQDLVTDEPGRTFKSGSPGARSATPPHLTAHDEAAVTFAHELANFLRHELEQRSYTSLAIAAPPHFLGTLRPLLAKTISQRLTASIPSDLVHLNAQELRSHIEPLLVPA